ncbi:DNA-processing protein DprA [Alicycliphilus denitrificans]|uniref:DNA-processing protein DprA n=1 Tax=Alicycliphilus denitrificans TaxID=179636 RepID=UPI0001DA01F8|nr:DNA-processing protein DprA [Alicycliphilus denitrificans]ADU99445.1 SMF family protein [Alicycliphilus denitrificans BC]
MITSELFAQQAVSPALELGAYEELWSQDGQSFKTLAELFRKSHNDLPSQFVSSDQAIKRAREVLEIFRKKHIEDAGFVVQGTLEYPEELRSARHPVQFLYYRGNLDLLYTPWRVALVGSREASDEGIRRARRLARCLVADGVVVVSGLAKGIDTAAHTAALEAGGQTVGVIGTPISEVYPRENSELQEHIARNYLLVSQVPVIRYMQQTPKWNRLFFPERNATMSALTQATIIVEAGETSGSLTQARAALEQGRKLFILNNCFERGLKWPARLQAAGAIRVSDYDEIRQHLGISGNSH